MSYYKKQLKRLARGRKLLNQQRTQLRELYHEVLSKQRQALQEEAYEVQQQWRDWREIQQQDKEFLAAAKLAQGHGKPPISYPANERG